jgi:hypothetical protein
MEWNIPKIWENGECWILGGGPSLTAQFKIPNEIVQGVLSGELPPSSYSPYLETIHGKHVIGVNGAFYIGNWIDIVAFGDENWFLNNRNQLLGFPKIKVAFCDVAEKGRFVYDGIKYVPRDGRKSSGITLRKNKISWNKNSGFASINLAYHLGVKRIILVGFDMDLNDSGKQHWHSLYRKQGRPPKSLPFDRHLRHTPSIKQDADELGIEIINASPDSKIKEFEKTTVEEILGIRL